MPRTMTDKEESEIRRLPASPSGALREMLLVELDAELSVSRVLAEALEQARQILHECAQDTIGTPTHDLFVGEVAACDTALAFYRESKQ